MMVIIGIHMFDYRIDFKYQSVYLELLKLAYKIFDQLYSKTYKIEDKRVQI